MRCSSVPLAAFWVATFSMMPRSCGRVFSRSALLRRVWGDEFRDEPGYFKLAERNDQTSGWIAVPPDGATDIVTISHLVFHLMQANVYRPAGPVLAAVDGSRCSLLALRRSRSSRVVVRSAFGGCAARRAAVRRRASR